jgi:hypothetical protein
MKTTKLQQEAKRVMRNQDKRRKRELAKIKKGVEIITLVGAEGRNMRWLTKGNRYTVRKVLDAEGTVEIRGDHSFTAKKGLPARLSCKEYILAEPLSSPKVYLDKIEKELGEASILLRSMREELAA